jgi:hypothetical protein
LRCNNAALPHGMLHCGSCTAVAALHNDFMLRCNSVLRRNIVQCNMTLCGATWLTVSRGTMRHVQLFHVEHSKPYGAMQHKYICFL